MSYAAQRRGTVWKDTTMRALVTIVALAAVIGIGSLVNAPEAPAQPITAVCAGQDPQEPSATLDRQVWAEVARLDALTGGAACAVTWTFVDGTADAPLAEAFSGGLVTLNRTRLARVSPEVVAAVVRHELGHELVALTPVDPAAFAGVVLDLAAGEQAAEASADAVGAVLAGMEGVEHVALYASILTPEAMAEAGRVVAATQG